MRYVKKQLLFPCLLNKNTISDNAILVVYLCDSVDLGTVFIRSVSEGLVLGLWLGLNNNSL